MAQQYNHLLASTGDATSKHVNLKTQVTMRRFGVSMKMDRPPKTPDVLKKAAALQTILLQVNGENKMSKAKLLVTSHALVTKTKLEGAFNHDYLFDSERAQYP